MGLWYQLVLEHEQLSTDVMFLILLCHSCISYILHITQNSYCFRVNMSKIIYTKSIYGYPLLLLTYANQRKSFILQPNLFQTESSFGRLFFNVSKSKIHISTQKKFRGKQKCTWTKAGWLFLRVFTVEASPSFPCAPLLSLTDMVFST